MADLRTLLTEVGADRPVYWLSNDPSEDLDELTYRLVALDGNEAMERRLAEFESYGEWLHWLDG